MFKRQLLMDGSFILFKNTSLLPRKEKETWKAEIYTNQHKLTKLMKTSQYAALQQIKHNSHAIE